MKKCTGHRLPGSVCWRHADAGFASRLVVMACDSSWLLLIVVCGCACALCLWLLAVALVVVGEWCPVTGPSGVSVCNWSDQLYQRVTESEVCPRQGGRR